MRVCCILYMVVREVTPWSCGRNDVVWIWGSTFSPREWFHYGIVSTSELWNLHLWIVSRGIWRGYEVLRWVNCSWTVLFADPRGLGSYTVWPRPVSYPVSNFGFGLVTRYTTAEMTLHHVQLVAHNLDTGRCLLNVEKNPDTAYYSTFLPATAIAKILSRVSKRYSFAAVLSLA